MAKKQLTYTGLGATLVEGAGKMYQSQNKSFGVDLTSGFEAMSRNISAANTQREAQREATEAKAANYLGQMEAIDMGVVPPTYKGNVEGALRGIKNEYFNTAMALKNMKPTNPEYLDLRDKLNSLNGSIRKISSTFADLAKNKKEDLEFISNRGYSAGNDQSKVDFLNSVLTGEAEMSIDSSGNVLFNHNGEFKSYENLPNIMPYDAKAFDSILTTLDGASNLNRQLTDSDRTLYKSKLMNIIKSGGRDTAISLGSDDFLVDGGIGLGGEAEYDANPEAYKQRLLNSYMGLFENAANESAQRYNAKLSGRNDRNNRRTSRDIPAAFSRLMEAMTTNPGGAVGGSLEADLAIPGLDVNPKKYKVGWDGNKIIFTDAVDENNFIAYDISDFYTSMWGLDVPEVFKPAPPVGQTNTSPEPVQGLPGGKPIGPSPYDQI